MKSAPQRFSIGLFGLQMVLQLALLLAAFRFLLPSVWEGQIAAGWPALALAFLAGHMGLCFFEWFFHRYVLHHVAFRVFRRFATDHRRHHSLTAIKLRPSETGPGRIILNEYPIVEPEQHDASSFPWYALIGFWGVFTPLLVGLQFLLPGAPILLGGYLAIWWSLSGYEIFHAVEHLPYEWWKRHTDHPRFGPLWTSVYGFHHMHHANVGCNEAISGFFGLPVADWVFGTYYQPRELLLDGRKATAKDFHLPTPRSFVKTLDHWARQREARLPVRGAAS